MGFGIHSSFAITFRILWDPWIGVSDKGMQNIINCGQWKGEKTVRIRVTYILGNTFGYRQLGNITAVLGRKKYKYILKVFARVIYNYHKKLLYHTICDRNFNIFIDPSC